ncbi:TonB-dependent receptor [Cytophagaceae bacterium SJW1-29]|uniref:TonB-dependent receptor n=1 Tax=Salmonirosea aquatica TaxID=2654236 RepID=A0A7C9FY77_9BACT|nr:TonB-dependent receptor [Cytophagaceae bacterium SJW1-29]
MRCISFLLVYFSLAAWTYGQKSLAVEGTLREGTEAIPGAVVRLYPTEAIEISDDNGFFRFGKLTPGQYRLEVRLLGYKTYIDSLDLTNQPIRLDIRLEEEVSVLSREVVVIGRNTETVSGRLNDVSGTAIYASKKTELINVRNLNANLATNNTRQIYARIPGLNIWEYDRGGLQLGIGGRGLSPNRSSNFNIRQNGYDISADALGYPESYYTPSAEALNRIEIIRGAASLQYGPQFGGLVNFIMQEGPRTKLIEFTTRQTGGSFGLFNSFNSLGGTVAQGKLNYYTFFQYKRGDSWRPNSHYTQQNGYLHLAYDLTPKLKVTGEYTHMRYLAQQPGGLTDAQFAEDASVSVRARNWFQVDWNLVSLNLDYKISETTRLNWRNYTLQGGREAIGALTYINRPDFGVNRDYMTDRYNNLGSELRFIHQYNLFGQPDNTFLIGGRAYRGLTVRKQGDGNNGEGPDFEFLDSEPNKSSFCFPGTNLAFFAENIFRIGKNWSITPGARFEYINTKAEGYYFKVNKFIPNEKIYETRTNPRTFMLLGIGTSRKFGRNAEFYANISQNYRSINFNDIRVVNTNARVDPNLKDETGFNGDLGLRGTFRNWLYADISVFYLKYNDRIGSIFSTDSSYMTYRLRTNVSDSRNLGLELLLDGDILQALTQGKSKYKLSLYTSLSLIDARYINTKNTAIANKLVENVPPVLFRTGLSTGTPRFNLTYQFAFQTKQYSDATNTEVTPTAVDGAIPAFSVMDLSARYSWRLFTLSSGVNNLTDSRYFTRRADGYPGPGILPADKRNYYLTLQFKI